MLEAKSRITCCDVECLWKIVFLKENKTRYRTRGECAFRVCMKKSRIENNRNHLIHTCPPNDCIKATSSTTLLGFQWNQETYQNKDTTCHQQLSKKPTNWFVKAEEILHTYVPQTSMSENWLPPELTMTCTSEISSEFANSICLQHFPDLDDAYSAIVNNGGIMNTTSLELVRKYEVERIRKRSTVEKTKKTELEELN